MKYLHASSGRFLSRIVFSVFFAFQLIVLGLTAQTVQAKPAGPKYNDKIISKLISLRMEQYHLLKHPLDDEISQRCMESYLKMLDPLKLNFLQSDIDGFMVKKNQLDDMFRKGNIQFAHDVFTVFLKRLDQRMTASTQLLEREFDFTLDEEMIRERDAAVYAKTKAEAVERWRKQVKFDLLREISDDKTADEAKERLGKRYRSISKRWGQTNGDDLLELYMSALTSGFDPHSSYMSASTKEDFDIQMNLQLDGIGATLRAEDGYTVVQDVISSGAAGVDGRIKKGDQIVGVGQGTGGEILDIIDMRLRDVVKLIRGKRGTIVRLEIEPVDNPNKRIVYDITRARVKLENQAAQGEIIDFEKKPNGKPYRIGVVQLPSFYGDMRGARLGLADYRSTTRDVRRLLEGFKQEDVDAVIVDLRFNGGGLLTESVNMTGLFIDEGPVVQVKGIRGRTMPLNDPEAGMVWSGPLVVLINKYSASASEIFAGAIQDYGRGLVVGDRSTHGKGTVQQMLNLGDIFGPTMRRNFGTLKLTIQQFYRPAGDSTQNRGVVSDIELPSLSTHLDVGESDLPFPVRFDQVKPLKHDRFGMVNANMLTQLRQLSTVRINKSEGFSKELKRIAYYNEQKDRSTITLNKEKFQAELKKLDATKDQEDAFEKQNDPDREVFEQNHYGTEALAITVDYVRALKNRKVAATRR